MLKEIDYERDINIFKNYIGENYDLNHPLIIRKYIHTLSVVKIMSLICKELNVCEEDYRLAFYIALFHDLGRFREVIRQNGFNNLKFDHGAYSNKVLFNDGFIDLFKISFEDYLIIKKAIYWHNKKDLPNDLTERERFFCELIRDADRIDIFRVLAEDKTIFEDVTIRVLEEFYKGESIDLRSLKTRGDRVILRFGFVKLFSFQEASKVLRGLGYFDNYVQSIKVGDNVKEIFDDLVLEINYILEGEKDYVRKKV